MAVTSEVELTYSVVRLVPDQIRQEFANVGVVVVAPGMVLIRTMREPSPLVRAIAPPTTKELFDRLPSLIVNRLGLAATAPPSNLPLLSERDSAPTSTNTLALVHGPDQPAGQSVLARLRESSLSGLWFTDQETVVTNLAQETPFEVANELYDEFVKPRRWLWNPTTASGRLQTQVRRSIRRALRKNAMSAATGLELVTRWGTYDFPVAYANGVVTLVQAVDLDVTPKQQQANTRTAIAVHAETDALLEAMSPSIEWLSVVKAGSDSDPFFERLRHFSPRVLLDTQIAELTAQIEELGGTPVEDFFRTHGFEAKRQESAVEVFADRKPPQ
jgi:hypothetical protein